MATLTYPADTGFAQWYAWRQHSSEESPLLIGEYTPASVAIPIRPIGALLWRGRFTTPTFGKTDPEWGTMRALMESLDQGVNDITLPVPPDQQSGVLGATIRAQPTRVDAAVRGSRGEVRGWTVHWVEVPDTPGGSPPFSLDPDPPDIIIASCVLVFDTPLYRGAALMVMTDTGKLQWGFQPEYVRSGAAHVDTQLIVVDGDHLTPGGIGHARELVLPSQYRGRRSAFVGLTLVGALGTVPQTDFVQCQLEPVP